jgi:hypothetical protein
MAAKERLGAGEGLAGTGGVSLIGRFNAEWRWKDHIRQHDGDVRLEIDGEL